MIIYNCMGQVVMKIDKPEEDQRIDCAHLQEGIYYIQSFFEGHQIVQYNDQRGPIIIKNIQLIMNKPSCLDS